MDGNQEALNGTRLCCSGGSRGGFWGGCPPYFWTKLRPKGPKKYWGGRRPGLPPLFQGLDLALCCFGGGRQN